MPDFLTDAEAAEIRQRAEDAVTMAQLEESADDVPRLLAERDALRGLAGELAKACDFARRGFSDAVEIGLIRGEYVRDTEMILTDLRAALERARAAGLLSQAGGGLPG